MLSTVSLTAMLSHIHVRLSLWENLASLIVGFAVFLVIRWLILRPANFPPGPWALPLIGNFSLLGENPEKIFPELRKKYGDVFSVYAGPKPLVIIGGADRIREVLVKQGQATSGRPETMLTDVIFKRKGLLSTQGRFWKEQRTFAVSTLREFGMGKLSLEGAIREEVGSFVELLRGFGGKPVQLQQAEVLAGPPPKDIFGMVVMPPLVFYLYLPGDFFSLKQIKKNNEVNLRFYRRMVAEHEKSFQSENIRDFTDAFLAQMGLRKEDPNSTFTEEQLVYLAADLGGAGSETTSTTILWGILYLTLYPEVQRRLQAELDEVVGRGRGASTTDKPNLSYTVATLLEIQRIAKLGLFLPAHFTTDDIKVGGYDIPRGTILLCMIGETLSDPDLWESPGLFNPDRFLIDGKVDHSLPFFPFSLGFDGVDLEMCVLPSVVSMDTDEIPDARAVLLTSQGQAGHSMHAFGTHFGGFRSTPVGCNILKSPSDVPRRRSCPGEALAKMELFLFFTALMQNFTFRVPPGSPNPSTARVLGLTAPPLAFDVCAVRRF